LRCTAPDFSGLLHIPFAPNFCTECELSPVAAGTRRMLILLAPIQLKTRGPPIHVVTHTRRRTDVDGAHIQN
jgi:hypothetical protein